MCKEVLDRLDIIEKAVAVLTEQIKSIKEESETNFILIDKVLESQSNCLDILVEQSPDLEMIYREDEEDKPTATILTLVTNNKDKGGDE